MNGYKQCGIKTCSRAAKNGNVLEHVAIAEKALGKPLPRKCQVHHFDGDHRNNANTNLIICQDAAYHRLLHFRQAVRAAGGDPNTQRICTVCKAVKVFGEFNRAKHDKATGLQSSCRACQRQYQKTYVRPDEREWAEAS